MTKGKLPLKINFKSGAEKLITTSTSNPRPGLKLVVTAISSKKNGPSTQKRLAYQDSKFPLSAFDGTLKMKGFSKKESWRELERYPATGDLLYRPKDAITQFNTSEYDVVESSPTFKTVAKAVREKKAAEKKKDFKVSKEIVKGPATKNTLRTTLVGTASPSTTTACRISDSISPSSDPRIKIPTSISHDSAFVGQGGKSDDDPNVLSVLNILHMLIPVKKPPRDSKQMQDFLKVVLDLRKRSPGVPFFSYAISSCNTKLIKKEKDTTKKLCKAISSELRGYLDAKYTGKREYILTKEDEMEIFGSFFKFMLKPFILRARMQHHDKNVELSALNDVSQKVLMIWKPLTKRTKRLLGKVFGKL